MANINTLEAVSGTTDDAQTFQTAFTDLFTLYSDKILYNALPAMRFEQFAVHREDLMKGPGDTIKFIRFLDVDGNPRLASELADPTIGVLSSESISITVDEFGQGQAFTERLLRTSPVDVMEQAATVLGRHYSQWGPDYVLRNTALNLNEDGTWGSTVAVQYGGNATSRATLDAADVLTTADIASAVETLQTNLVPKFMNEFYVCIAHPHQLASLKTDPEWVAAQNYGQTRALFTGEEGMWSGVVFLSDPNLPNGSISSSTHKAYNALLRVNGAGAGNPAVAVYTAVIFGDEYYALATALPVQMRAETPEGFGRRLKIAWYAVYGAGRLNSDHGIRLETA